MRRTSNEGRVCSRARAHAAVGMTLIELMISVLLAAILVGGLFYMMAGQDRTYTSQVRLLTAQQNMWSAMEFMQTEVRKAGFGFTGCGGDIHTFKPADGGIAYDSGAMPTVTLVAMEIKNNYNLFTGVADGTDSLALRYVDYTRDGGFGMGIRVTHAVPPKSGSMGSEHFYVNNGSTLAKDDLIIICAPGADFGYVLKISGDPKQKSKDNDGDGQGDWLIEHNHGKGDGWNLPFGEMKKLLPEGGFPEGATIMKLGNVEDVHYYAIDNTRDPPMLVTWMGTDKTTREVIAAGIEDMQVSWACRAAPPETGPVPLDADWQFDEGACVDSNGDGKCTCCIDTSVPPDNTCDTVVDNCDARKTDEWANNTPGDTNPDCTNKSIAMVRITLGARTTSGVVGDRTGFRPGAEDRPTGTPAQDLAKTGGVGTYGRATLTAKVQPRNIRQKK